MKETNLNIFFQLGASLNYLRDHTSVNMDVKNLFSDLFLPQDWLRAFLEETRPFDFVFKDTRRAAERLLETVQHLLETIPEDWERKTTQPEVLSIFDGIAVLEKNLEHDHRNLSVFTVTPKGLYDTRLLIEKAEIKFNETTRSVFSDRVIYDLQQCGKCLAFEVPTAMAFHVMRATESLIKQYYEVLAGKSWPYRQRDWGKYIVELEKCPDVNLVITGRLKEIKNLNRNPLIHPEEVVTLEEAPVIFDLCNGVMYYMADEIRKRNSHEQ